MKLTGTKKTFNIEMTLEELESLEFILYCERTDTEREIREYEALEDVDPTDGYYDFLLEHKAELVKLEKGFKKILKVERGCK